MQANSQKWYGRKGRTHYGKFSDRENTTDKKCTHGGHQTTLVQAWKTTKEVKIENLGNNIFIFKFGLKVDKQKVMARGPWHFDIALIMLKEQNWKYEKARIRTCSILDSNHNVPLVCMERENVQKLGGLLGDVLLVHMPELEYPLILRNLYRKWSF